MQIEGEANAHEHPPDHDRPWPVAFRVAGDQEVWGLVSMNGASSKGWHDQWEQVPPG